MAIYVGARDLSGLAIGTHQFIVITFENPTPPLQIGLKKVAAKPLGRGVRGIVIGAQNRGKLVAEFHEKGDLTAAMEYFGGVETNWHTSDYDAQLIEVGYGNLPEQEAKRRVINLIGNYILNQTVDPIKYPTAGFGVNSNSWVQSVIEYSGGNVDGDMKGFDISNSKRVPRTYFMPFCPVAPRVKVN
ncbi:hypothetical protein MHM95_12510 [Pseudoalteromonas sp. CnMc7-15]|uniref:hypothetical protein n=1 Tax=unclassified Pseudoalteromonas TaxID=194690 RepID=UPI001EF43E1D|nr:hypothetical protein [Pseudoalteromonas sp. CnMc7-15]MCG7567103.1 hypothetical protein [Pseudoalteromonas sp. CnMc7-15]